jgi:UDP-glucose 4-epimerase
MINIGASVLVTGGAGFIGSHLVEKLLAGGAQTTVIDNLSTGSLANLGSVIDNITLIVGDLGDLLRHKQLVLEQYDFIFHLAANPYIPPSVENPTYDFQQNLHNTVMLLETLRVAANPPRLVNTSSAAVYGNPVRLPIEENDATVPISPYGVSKLAAERYVAVYSQLYGLRATSLRLFSVYGPRQRKQVIYDLLHRLRQNPGQLEILGDGSQERDFVFVQDVVQAMLLAATDTPGRGEAYNVASGKTITIRELATAICNVCGLRPKITYSGSIRLGDAEKWTVNVTSLRQLGHSPTISLYDGLMLTREWYDQTTNL